MNLPPLPPVLCHTKDLDLQYTAEQMQAYGKQCRAEALEEAAKCAEDYPTYGEATAEEIRGLI